VRFCCLFRLALTMFERSSDHPQDLPQLILVSPAEMQPAPLLVAKCNKSEVAVTVKGASVRPLAPSTLSASL
jgi:hypothetical protein